MELLEKLIQAINVTRGITLEARAAKIVSGLEPENTNVLLQELANAANMVANGEITMDAVVARLNGNDTVGGKKAPSPVTLQAASPVLSRGENFQPPLKAENISVTQIAETKSAIKSNISENGKVISENNAVDLGGEVLMSVLASNAPDTPHWIVDTQKALQPLFERPKLLAKTLSKPPFAFLHDIARAITKSTGFFDKLFTDAELDRENLKESKPRAVFLKKFIDAVSLTINKPISVNISKILAGAEPEKTNELLRDLAHAAKSGVSFSQILLKLSASEAPKPSSFVNLNATTIMTIKDPIAVESSVPSEPVKQEISKTETAKEAIAVEPVKEMDMQKEDEKDTPVKIFERPRTARRAPPKVKTNVEDKAPEKIDEPVLAGVLLETDVAVEEDEEMHERMEEAIDTIDGSGGRLKLEIAKSLAENRKSYKSEPPSINVNGSIVFSGRLGSAKLDKSSQGKIEQKRANDQLRDWIQQLCQSINPLGKCVEFVHEDMEIMEKELSRWQREYQVQSEIFAQEQRKTDEVLAPLYRQMDDLEKSRQEQEIQVAFLTASILRNEAQIRQSLDIHAQGIKM